MNFSRPSEFDQLRESDSLKIDLNRILGDLLPFVFADQTQKLNSFFKKFSGEASPWAFFAFYQGTECEGELHSGAMLPLELSYEVSPWGFLHSVR